MDNKTSIYYDGTKLLSLKDINGEPPEIFICTTNRTAGKTTYFGRALVRKFLKTGAKFCLVYRFKTELKGCEDKFFKDESSTHTFRGATDSEFTDAVFCDKDIAIKSRVCVAYVNAKLWGVDKEYGCKGWFKMNLLEDRIFKAFVLVKRAVVLEGNTVEMFTWAIRTCDGEPEQPTNGGNGDGGKPSDKPTAEPTIQPTAEPTTKPTHSPTEAPTTAPTEAPTTAPTIEPTVKPTHSPTEAPRPTHSPTEAPTAAPTKEPTQQPSYKPTPVPEVTPEPTNRHSDTGDEGSGNSHSPTDDDNSTSGGNRHSDASDSSTSNGNRHSEP